MDQVWIIAVGVLGNIISFMVYLAPLPTFYRVYKKKSTQGFQSLPYITALFSAMLWIYYALLKKDNAGLLIVINGIGCFIESIYIIMFLFYAPRTAKVYTVKLISLLNIGVYGLIVLVTMLSSVGSKRTLIVGWICVGCSVCVFVAPLSVMRLVITTKSVQFMPFSLSFSLTVSAVVWFLYGLLTKDRYVALPNILGFGFGVAQMVLYIVYKDGREIKQVTKEPEHVITVPRMVATPGSEVYPIDSSSEGGEEEKAYETGNNGGQKGSVGRPEEIELSHCDIV